MKAEPVSKGTIEKDLLRKFRFIVGCDEVGRGCLAGSVYASAVILDYSKLEVLADKQKKLIRDSKTLSKKQREDCLLWLPDLCLDAATCFASVSEIETLGILKASFLAMQRALQSLKLKFDFILIDGKQTLAAYPNSLQKAVIKGDSLCYSIAAASIFAKQARDLYMAQQAKVFPGYFFEDHVGYGTKKHKEALELYGVTSLHRKNYAPIRELLSR